ncbi:hypothetical protein ON010_g17708 [Phytophthora cinnamomi]|nr:hypothetical protein ON010_g17708 [Phytophthora cinnamomi]
MPYDTHASTGQASSGALLADRRLADKLNVLSWQHHERKYNKMADSLANSTMDSKRSVQQRPSRAFGGNTAWMSYTRMQPVTLVTGSTGTTMRTLRNERDANSQARRRTEPAVVRSRLLRHDLRAKTVPEQMDELTEDFHHGGHEALAEDDHAAENVAAPAATLRAKAMAIV